MDFTALIKKSFSIARENKILWLFGFLSGGVGSAGAGNLSGFNFSIPAPSSETPKFETEQTNELILGAYDKLNQVPIETWVFLGVAIAVVVLAIFAIGIFVSNWSAAALVSSILQRNTQKPTFSSGAKYGMKYWWRFYLVSLVFGLVLLGIALLLGFPVVILFLAGFTPLAIAILIAVVLIFILFLIVYSVVGSLILVLSQRMIVHRGVGVMESIRLSGGLLKTHKGESLLTYVVALGLNMAVSFVMLIILFPLLIIGGILFFVNLWWVIPIIAIPVMIGLFIFSGFLQAFNASYWTLFYEHLAAKEGW